MPGWGLGCCKRREEAFLLSPAPLTAQRSVRTVQSAKSMKSVKSVGSLFDQTVPINGSGLTQLPTPRFMINPDWACKNNWDWMVIVLVIFNAVMVPIQIAFVPPFAQDAAFVAWDWLVTLIFATDVAVNLLTGFQGNWGTKVYDKRQIFNRYLKGMLIIDVLAVIPFELVAPGADLTFANLLKLPRLLRLGRLTKKVELLAAANAFRIVVLLCGFVLVAHVLACAWWFLGVQLISCAKRESCDLEVDQVWISVYLERDPDDISLSHAYIVSLLFSLTTMTTIGYGGVAPTNSKERVFAVAMLVTAAVCHAVIFGNMAVQITEWDKTMQKYKSKLRALREFFKLHELKPELRQRTLKYFDSLWSINRGLEVDKTLGSLPPMLQADVMMALHHRLVESVPIFKNVSEAFIRAIVVRLQPQVALRGDYIVRRGEAATAMFFVYKGKVVVLKPNPVQGESEIKVELHPGQFFGESALLADSKLARRNACVKALSLTQLYTLSSCCFMQVIKDFPEYKKLLEESENRRYEVAKYRAVSSKVRMALRLRKPNVQKVPSKLSEDSSTASDSDSSNASGATHATPFSAEDLLPRRLSGNVVVGQLPTLPGRAPSTTIGSSHCLLEGPSVTSGRGHVVMSTSTSSRKTAKTRGHRRSITSMLELVRSNAEVSGDVATMRHVLHQAIAVRQGRRSSEVLPRAPLLGARPAAFSTSKSTRTLASSKSLPQGSGRSLEEAIAPRSQRRVSFISVVRQHSSESPQHPSAAAAWLAKGTSRDASGAGTPAAGAAGAAGALSVFAKAATGANHWVQNIRRYRRLGKDGTAADQKINPDKASLPVTAAVILQKVWRHRDTLNKHLDCVETGAESELAAHKAILREHTTHMLNVQPWRRRLRVLVAQKTAIEKEKRSQSVPARVNTAMRKLRMLRHSTAAAQQGMMSRLEGMMEEQTSLLEMARCVEKDLRTKSRRLGLEPGRVAESGSISLSSV